ncbi:hypothetical protein EB796_007573 [Bugula neritina]|uniref:Uncharacterized protein n=1 Tax=Bugula neritina TaxID=10212 RepID=A0A7J7K865_BUGNE|nr:hypothetical protein EB796_007573 [Bugula neritina]
MSTTTRLSDVPCVMFLKLKYTDELVSEQIRNLENFITLIGWNTCNAGREWFRAYHGYLMAAESNHGTSQPICMDINPEVTEGYGTDPAAPEVKLVRSGRGLWVEKKAVPCVVCIKNN